MHLLYFAAVLQTLLNDTDTMEIRADGRKSQMAIDAEGSIASTPQEHSRAVQTRKRRGVNKPAPTYLILLHCYSQLERIVRFRHSLTPAENGVCCSEYSVLTVRL